MQRSRTVPHNAPAPAGSAMLDPAVARAVRGKQRQLLGVILIVMVGLLSLNIALAVLLVGPQVLTLRALGPSLCGMAGGLLGLWLLYRQRFFAAATAALVGFLIGDTWEFARAGLLGNEISMLMFMVPIILAGLLLDRRVLYLTFATVLGVVLGVHALEISRAPTDSLGATGAVILFSLILTLLVLFFDRFGITLRDALISQAAISVENARLYDEARRLNETLEQRVLQRTSQLQEANRELEAFSYSVSHDLRTPLRGIDGFSQALQEDYGDKLDEGAAQYLQRIRAGTLRMGEIIDDLLMLARISRMELEPTRVDLSALAHKVAEDLRAREPERQVEVRIAEGLEVQGDARLLRLALENLLGNALKFTVGQAEACIIVGKNEQGAFLVRDNGAGFDMAYSDKLFAPFQRLHAPEAYEGSGIGLATTQRIIDRHGGRIWAEGKVGQGATFYFTLPAGETSGEVA